MQRILGENYFIQKKHKLCSESFDDIDTMMIMILVCVIAGKSLDSRACSTFLVSSSMEIYIPWGKFAFVSVTQAAREDRAFVAMKKEKIQWFW